MPIRQWQPISILRIQRHDTVASTNGRRCTAGFDRMPFLAHGGEFYHDLVDENVNIGERIPWGRRHLGSTSGNAPQCVALMLLTTIARSRVVLLQSDRRSQAPQLQQSKHRR
jgi:hypothetical protein